MNGKILKVVEYQLSFGSHARMVNVFGVFRYKKNQSLYVIYADVGSTYPVVYYGGSHIKENSILSISPRDGDEEIVKEYIFKVTNGKKLDDFEIISLDSIDSIELISSSHLEIKMDVMNDLIDKTIPKVEEKVEEDKKSSGKKKKSNKFVFVLLVILLLLGGVYFYLSYFNDSNRSTKSFTCIMSRNDSALNANIEVTGIYYFDYQDVLDNFEITNVFHFLSENSYQDFINKGIMYRYMPSDEQGGYSQDDESHTFTFLLKQKVDSNYQDAVDYEEILFNLKKEGYTCEEKVLGE